MPPMTWRAEQVDVYLTWGEPPAAVAQKLADVRERAARNGRTVKFGIRLHVIVRETAEDAWKAADKLIEHISDETIAAAQKSFSLRLRRPTAHGCAA